MTEPLRCAWAEVDLDVVRANAEALGSAFSPAQLCAVVKADGYGHGAVAVAQAALAGGAGQLAVALVEEGRDLRDAGIAAPILVLSEPRPAAMAEVVSNRLVPTIYSFEGVDAAADAVAERGGPPLPVHLKVDTGMHRVGADPAEVVRLAQTINESPNLVLEGLFTHFATADEAESTFLERQAAAFRSVIGDLELAGLLPPVVHCANSAAGLLYPHLRMSMVRCGIALYGLAPSDDVPLPDGVRPAMSVRAGASFVRRVEPGERLSYGQHYEVGSEATIATVPVGYADGMPRSLFRVGAEVLIGGRRHPIAGAVTMDQFLVDCGDAQVRVGDEVVLLGAQGDEEVGAAEWAELLGTISYEIVCRIGPRLPRRYHGRPGSIEARPPMSEELCGASIPVDGEPLAAGRASERLHPVRAR